MECQFNHSQRERGIPILKNLSPAQIRITFPNASHSTLAANGALPNPKPEHHEETALGATVCREEESAARITVRFTGYRVRPLDPDNFAGSVKDLLDGLRHAHLIPGDEPWKIKLETEQRRVASFDEERTDIEIAWPEG